MSLIYPTITAMRRTRKRVRLARSKSRRRARRERWSIVTKRTTPTQAQTPTDDICMLWYL